MIFKGALLLLNREQTQDQEQKQGDLPGSCGTVGQEAIGDLDQGGGNRGGEKWTESRHILNELSSE